MSERRNELTIALESVVCPRCEARPGKRCMTIGGKLTHLHASRVRPLFEAWHNGYADGREDGRRFG